MIYQTIRHKFLLASGIVKTNGFVSLLKWVPEVLFLNRKFYILEYDLEKAESAKDLPNNWEIRKNDFDFLDYCRKSIKELPLEFYYDKIDGCRHFYILTVNTLKGHEPASICWIYDNNLVNRNLQLKDSEVEMKHGYTMNVHRGKGMNTVLVNKVLYDLKTEGYKKVINVIEEHNAASMKIFIKKFHFKIIGEKTLRKIAGISLMKKYES